MVQPIIIVQGAQWGSEAKGAVALALCERLGVDIAVRTGSINAGHTVIHNGVRTAFQQLPVAAVLPHIRLLLGAGAYIHQETLDAECLLVDGDWKSRLLIDNGCGVHNELHTQEATQAARNLRIGATGKGCAEAIIHKIADRGLGNPHIFGHVTSGRYIFGDVSSVLNDAYDHGDRILLEGTQGSLLDFHLGPYPYVTSRQTTAAAWVTEAGLSPSLAYEVVLVARTYPIRVAGNSGPMPNEINWPELARRINVRLVDVGLCPLVSQKAIDAYTSALNTILNGYGGLNDHDKLLTDLHASSDAMGKLDGDTQADLRNLFETTTVTKRLRRVAELSTTELARVVKLERPSYVVLTFLNYVYPELAPTHNPSRRLHDDARRYINGVEKAIHCQVKYTTIGPTSADLIDVQ